MNPGSIISAHQSASSLIVTLEQLDFEIRSISAALQTAKLTLQQMRSERQNNGLTEWMSVETGIKLREQKLHLNNRTIESLRRQIRDLEQADRAADAATVTQVSAFGTEVVNMVTCMGDEVKELAEQWQQQKKEMEERIAVVRLFVDENTDASVSEEADPLMRLWSESLSPTDIH